MQARTLVKRALRTLGVVAEANEPSADMIADGLETLGEMLAGWELEGVRLGAAYPVVADTDVPLAAREIQTARLLLAAALAPDYGRDAARYLAQAHDGWRGMMSERLQPRIIRDSEWRPFGAIAYDQSFFGGAGGAEPPPVIPPPVIPPPPLSIPLPLSGRGVNFERDWNIALGTGDGVPTATVQHFAQYFSWMRAFVFMTTQLGHGTRTLPSWPSDPLSNTNFARLITTLDRCVAAGMKIVYAFVPGYYSDGNFNQDPTILDPTAFAAYLTAGAAWMAARYPADTLVMSPWNETSSGDNAAVNGLIVSAHAALRAGAPDHWLLFSGPDFGRIWRIADIAPFADVRHVAIDTHDYEIVRNSEFAFSNRTSFYAQQETRLGAPIVIGEFDPAPNTPTGYQTGYPINDPTRFEIGEAFLAAAARPGAYWSATNGTQRRLNNPIDTTNGRLWPALENFLAPGTHTITVSPPASATVTLPHALTISGTYTGRPTVIEARVGGSSWQTLDAAPTGGTYTGTFNVTTTGTLAVEVRFANGTQISASTTVVLTPAVVSQTLAISGTPGDDLANYSGTYTPASPTPQLRVYAVQAGVDVASEAADINSAGAFSGVLDGLPEASTTLRAEVPDGAEAFTATFAVPDDVTGPTVTMTTPPAADNFKTGDLLDAFVQMSEPTYLVEGSETPYINVTIGANVRKMVALSGPTASDWSFRYTIASDDADADGIAIDTTVNLAGGTFKDAAGNNADFSALAWASTAGVLVNQPEVTLQPPSGTYSAGATVNAAGTTFPDDTATEIVWRQSGADVGAAVAVTEVGRDWTGSIVAPATAGTYTLRARHVAAPSVFAESGSVIISAAGATELSYASGFLDVRGDNSGTVTTAGGSVSAWTSGQGITGTLSNGTAANQPMHSLVTRAASFSGTAPTDTNGDFLACAAVRDRYRVASGLPGIFYGLMRRTANPTWNWTLIRLGRSDSNYSREFGHGYGLTMTTSGGFRIIREAATSSTYKQADVGAFDLNEWGAFAWVINGTSDSISRVYIKTQAGGSRPAMVTNATASGTSPLSATNFVCDVGRSRWHNFASLSGQVAALDVHSLGFDAVVPDAAAIEANLDRLLARV